jgi:hypothetical protein
MLALGLVLLLLGTWGCIKGWQTLGWMPVEAKIQGEDVRGDGAMPVTANVPEVYYSYAVGSAEYLSYGVAPYPFGLRMRRAEADRYQPNMRVRAVADPDRPNIAYLEPGPSAGAMIVAGAGLALALAGLLLRCSGRG